MYIETLEDVIRIIDSRLKVIEESFIYNPDSDVTYDTGQQIGKQKALTELKDYLQEYIKGGQ